MEAAVTNVKRLCQPLVEAGEMDPAWFHACLAVEWFPAGRWPEGAVSVGEMRLRQQEFNSAVDEYIAQVRAARSLNVPMSITIYLGLRVKTAGCGGTGRRGSLLCQSCG